MEFLKTEIDGNPIDCDNIPLNMETQVVNYSIVTNQTYNYSRKFATWLGQECKPVSGKHTRENKLCVIR